MKIKKIAVLIAFSLMLSACSAESAKEAAADNVTSAVSLSETAEEIINDGLDDSEHSHMIRRSLVSVGNTYRLNEKLSVLENGGSITVGFLGGSITEGYTVRPEECYAKLTYDYLAEKYPAGNLEYVNAGISGTPSILGNLRAGRDIISKGADIVFIEYAVNDGTENIYRESYDSLVKTLLEQDNAPAVILLFNRTKEGHTAQDYMKQIGSYYDLGMISTADALTPALRDGNVQWSDYYNDSSHPSPEGHKLFLEFISYYFDRAAETECSEYNVKPIGINEAPYENALMAEADYDNSDERLKIEDIGCFSQSAGGLNGFRAGWSYDPQAGDDPMRFTIKGNSLWLICSRNNSDAMGSIEVYVDGTLLKTIHLNDKSGWGDPWAYQIMKWGTVKERSVELRVPEDSKDKKTELLAIGVSAVEKPVIS